MHRAGFIFNVAHTRRSSSPSTVALENVNRLGDMLPVESPGRTSRIQQPGKEQFASHCVGKHALYRADGMVTAMPAGV